MTRSSAGLQRLIFLSVISLFKKTLAALVLYIARVFSVLRALSLRLGFKALSFFFKKLGGVISNKKLVAKLAIINCENLPFIQNAHETYRAEGSRNG